METIEKSIQQVHIDRVKTIAGNFKEVEITEDQKYDLMKSKINETFEKGFIDEGTFNKALEQLDNLIEKSHKAASIGDIHDWGGKKYRKQTNGKWLEVSESHGMTKNEHQEQSDLYDRRHLAVLDSGVKNDLHFKNFIFHDNQASKLSNKEHSDEEVGLGERKNSIKKSSELSSEEAGSKTIITKNPDTSREEKTIIQKESNNSSTNNKVGTI